MKDLGCNKGLGTGARNTLKGFFLLGVIYFSWLFVGQDSLVNAFPKLAGRIERVTGKPLGFRGGPCRSVNTRIALDRELQGHDPRIMIGYAQAKGEWMPHLWAVDGSEVLDEVCKNCPRRPVGVVRLRGLQLELLTGDYSEDVWHVSHGLAYLEGFIGDGRRNEFSRSEYMTKDDFLVLSFQEKIEHGVRTAFIWGAIVVLIGCAGMGLKKQWARLR